MQFWERLGPVRRRVRARFEVDTRALAAVRIALGTIILVDLLTRAGDIALYYTDDGVYPRAVYESASQYSGFSVHALSGELWVQQLLFVVAGLFAVALILGYRTRLVGFVSLGLLLSLQARNPAVLNAGDRLLRVVLFVALLSPLGERWSVDALRRGSARPSVVGFTTAALLAQPLAVFTSNAILKHGGDTWYAGKALEIALADEVTRRFVGDIVVRSPLLLEALNWLWVALLAGSVAFLLLTTGRLRAVFALAYLGAFAGMVVSLSVGLFPLVLAASVLPYLTTPFWDRLARLVPAGWRDRLPTAADLGPLGRPPFERRGLDWLCQHGHGTAASLIVQYGRSLLTVSGLIVFVWVVLFSAAHATALDLPDGIDSVPNEQRWGVYAPNPSQGYSWYVVEAQLADGSTVYTVGDADRALDRPPDGSEVYDTFRHRKYMSSVHSSALNTTPHLAERYLDWACERVGSLQEYRVEQVGVVRFHYADPVGSPDEGPERWLMLEQQCEPAAEGR